MSKLRELSIRLRKSWDTFKHDPEYTKSRAKVLLKITQDALREIERLEIELTAYRQPKLWIQSKAEPVPEVVKLSRVERIQAFLKGDLESEEFKRFLKWQKLTLEEAIKEVEASTVPV